MSYKKAQYTRFKLEVRDNYRKVKRYSLIVGVALSLVYLSNSCTQESKNSSTLSDLENKVLYYVDD